MKLGMVEKFPYTIVPNTLREFLSGIPDKAVPSKVTSSYLNSIGLKSSNDRSIIGPLKAVNLLDSNGVPSEVYEAFRAGPKGALDLATSIKKAYAELYGVYDNAHNETDDNLRTFFTSKTKLGPNVIKYQLATFKVFCEFANFSGNTLTASAHVEPTTVRASPQLPAFHIDLHIHLPDSKDPLVHDLIFQAISKHILKGTST